MSASGREVDDLAAWDAAAERYVEAVGSGSSAADRFRAFVDEELGDPGGLRILDVGCGHGWLTGELALRGARAVGVDGSSRLLDVARRDHPAASFVRADLSAGLPPEVASSRFDRVVALMALMDLPRLDLLLSDVARCLVPEGRLIVTMTHPAFFGQTPVDEPLAGTRYRRVSGYLAHEQRWISTFGGHRHYHRPLGWYVDQLAANGMAVTRLFEPPPPPPEGSSADYGEWFSTIPTMLGLVARPIEQPACRNASSAKPAPRGRSGMPQTGGPRPSAGEVVQAHLAAFSSGDLPAMLATMAPDAVFVSGTTRVAPRDFEEFFGRAMREIDPVVKITNLVVEGRYVACEFVESVTLGGERKNLNRAAFYAVDHDVITSAKVYDQSDRSSSSGP